MRALWTMPSSMGHRAVDQNEIIANAGFLIAAVLAGLWGYYSRPKKADQPQNQVMTAIGLGWLERQQTEMFLSSVERCAKAQERIATAVEILADRRQIEMEDHLEDMAKKIDQLLIKGR